MDNSHVALVSLELRAEAFEDTFRCDRDMSLGMNIASLHKIVKTAAGDEQLTIQATEDSDVLRLVFAAKSVSARSIESTDDAQSRSGWPSSR